MPVLHEPVDPDLASILRRAVLDLRGSERRRTFGPAVQVGHPGQVTLRHPVASDEDHGVRCDVVGALLRALLTALPAADARAATPAAPLLWLTRTGDLSLHDVDAAWLAAGQAAYAEAGVPLTMVVVTKQGWWDPRSGAHRVWKRLRER